MLLPALAIVVGFGALVFGADRFVVGASATALSLGVSTLVIGLTIVGFGTSAPEMLVSAMAAGTGSGSLAVGNAIGSNITNTALVLGAAALVAPLTVHSNILRRELPLLIGIVVLSWALLFDGDFARLDGVVLLVGFAFLVAFMIGQGIRDARKGDPLEAEFDQEIRKDLPLWLAIVWTVVGLVFLVGSARLVVWGAESIARDLGVSELVIGLTVVAIGTSLPELAASVTAAMKNEHDIAIGNVVGSNMFNLLCVLALPGAIDPGPIDAPVLSRDFPVMAGLTLLLLVLARGFRVRSQLTRPAGALLLACFVAYLVLLFVESR